MSGITQRVLIGLLYGDVLEADFARVKPGDLFQAAVNHQVEAHVLWRLANLTFSDGDAAVAREQLVAGLQQWCMRTAAMNLRRDANARPLVQQMDQAGIQVMLLKGTALRVRYRGLTGRPQCDTDVMVRREHLERAEEVLLSAGYQADLRTMSRQDCLDHHFHLRMTRGDDIVELHWSMSNEGAPGAMDRIWERSVPVDWHGVRAWLPSVEDELVFTQIHLSRHCFARGLRWVGDLLYQVEHWEGDDERLADVRRDWPERFLDAPLLVVEEFWEFRYPVSIDIRGCGSWLDRRLLGSLGRALVLDGHWSGLASWRLAPALVPWLWHGHGSLSGGVAKRLGRLAGAWTGMRRVDEQLERIGD